MGAALATLFAYMSMAAALYRQAQKVYPVPYDWRRVGMLSLIVLIGFGIDRYISSTILWSSGTLLSIRAAIVAAVIGALFLFGFFSRTELAAIKEMARLRRGQLSPSDQSPPDPIEATEERREGR